MIFVLASFDADSASEDVRVPESLVVTESEPFSYPEQEVSIPALYPRIPYAGTSFIGFREALAFKESGGDYFTTNTLGYLGKYQFGIGTLQLMGVYNATKFLETPELQEKAFATNLARNKWILRRDIPRFVGKRINGVEVTESGILAAAHLAGAGNVKKYLRSWGSMDVVDAYGTSITYYLRKFKGYDMSEILAEQNPKVLF
ncbi:hypothetical protein [Robiginitalea sp. SC105]|uniref:hypothetical protein n=1 Tax=Robiginitalea sp. SC105 TaxID=2762332 RepID=UPI002107DF90|nr:hypothetical protein [Robiginitalea sp. SC105]